MAIISYEELEQQVENEVVEETPVMDPEAAGEVAEKAEGELEAIQSLDDSIEAQDELIEAADEKMAEGELQPEELSEVQNTLVDNMVANEHYLQVICGASTKKLAETFKLGLSFEDIQSNPVGAMRAYNDKLKAIRSNISQEHIAEIQSKLYKANLALSAFACEDFDMEELPEE